MIGFIADGLIFIIMIAGGAALLAWTPRPKIEAYKYAVMAGLTSLLVAKLLSILYQPTGGRPFERVGGNAGAAYIDNPGFPSDHALFATVIVMAVIGLTGHRRVGICLGVLVIIMCIGRVLALVHTPFDITGGIVAGVVGSVWYLAPERIRKSK